MKPSQSIPHSALRTPHAKSAFTLLEIMLVIVIIGIIAAIAISNIDPGAASDNARRTSTAVTIGEMSTAVARYQMDTGRLPANLEALVTNPGTPGWKGPYLRRLRNDAWGEPFTYTASGSSFEIRSNATGSEAGPISSNDL